MLFDLTELLEDILVHDFGLTRSNSCFDNYRQTTATSNMKTENVLKNALTRMHFMAESEMSSASGAFLRQQTRLERSAVAISASHLEETGRTVMTNKFMATNKVFQFYCMHRCWQLA